MSDEIRQALKNVTIGALGGGFSIDEKVYLSEAIEFAIRNPDFQKQVGLRGLEIIAKWVLENKDRHGP